MASTFVQIEQLQSIEILRLQSADGTNRLTLDRVIALSEAITLLAENRAPLVIAGNQRFFSAGAELNEIAALTATEAYEFSRSGQALMAAIENFPAPIYAAISGYCMGGGLDLALDCHSRIASPDATFGHRGAALGLITGWGGTERLPRLVGKGRALEIFVTAEKISAAKALEMRLIDAIAADPIAEAVERIHRPR